MLSGTDLVAPPWRVYYVTPDPPIGNAIVVLRTLRSGIRAGNTTQLAPPVLGAVVRGRVWARATWGRGRVQVKVGKVSAKVREMVKGKETERGPKEVLRKEVGRVARAVLLLLVTALCHTRGQLEGELKTF